MLRVLVLSTLYPNAAQPHHGIFVENRVQATAALGAAQFTVVAPVPFFPSGARIFGAYGAFARAPRQEMRGGLPVHHPRYPVIPKIGMHVAPRLMAAALLRPLERLIAAGGGADVLDAHYLYPDGVAAALLGRRLGLPLMLTARGSDVTEIGLIPGPKRMILAAVAQAGATVTVSAALARDLIALGAAPQKLRVLRNGVDLALFAPGDRAEARAAWGVTGPTLVSVGGLVARKGHALTLRALARLPGWRLLIAGQGPDQGALAAEARALGVAERVRFLGAVPHRALPMLYRAAEASVLMSSREGWANVILESLAAGTPVIASDAGGTREFLRPPAGIVLAERSAEALASAVAGLAAAPPDRVAVRAYAEGFGWEQVARMNQDLLAAVARGAPLPGRPPEVPAAAESGNLTDSAGDLPRSLSTY